MTIESDFQQRLKILNRAEMVVGIGGTAMICALFCWMGWKIHNTDRETIEEPQAIHQPSPPTPSFPTTHRFKTPVPR